MGRTGPATLMEKVLPENKPIESFEIEDNFPGLGRRVFNLNARKIFKRETTLPGCSSSSRTSPTANSVSATP